MHKDFTLKQLEVLYKHVLQEDSAAKHYAEHEEWPEVAEHYHKREALLELLENLYCFHKGGGANECFNSTPHQRVKSFEKVFVK